MNIYEKLVEVRKSINNFTKDASGYNYKYVSGSQVLKEIKNKLDELKIILETHLTYPIVEQTQKGGYLVKSAEKMIWINAEKPEDRTEINWFCTGEQKDPSQALGSALTYSERYFILKYFGIPTDEDDPDKLISQKETKKETKKDPDLELKKELMKKHNGNKEKAKEEYEKIIAERNAKTEQIDEDYKYIEEKFEMEKVWVQIQTL